MAVSSDTKFCTSDFRVALPRGGKSGVRVELNLTVLSVSIGSPDNEERRIIAEYETVTRFYYWAISELSRQRGLLPRDAYDKMLKLTEDARTDRKRARLALEEFRKNHENSK